MVDFREYHNAHSWLLQIQSNKMQPDLIVGDMECDARQHAVSYLTGKMLRCRTGHTVQAFVRKDGLPYLSEQSAMRSERYRSLKAGALSWDDSRLTTDHIRVVFVMEIGGFAIVATAKRKVGQAA